MYGRHSECGSLLSQGEKLVDVQLAFDEEPSVARSLFVFRLDHSLRGLNVLGRCAFLGFKDILNMPQGFGKTTDSLFEVVLGASTLSTFLGQLFIFGDQYLDVLEELGLRSVDLLFAALVAEQHLVELLEGLLGFGQLSDTGFDVSLSRPNEVQLSGNLRRWDGQVRNGHFFRNGGGLFLFANSVKSFLNSSPTLYRCVLLPQPLVTVVLGQIVWVKACLKCLVKRLYFETVLDHRFTPAEDVLCFVERVPCSERRGSESIYFLTVARLVSISELGKSFIRIIKLHNSHSEQLRLIVAALVEASIYISVNFLLFVVRDQYSKFIL